ncbi:MAG TPA: phosphoribosylformylglycinamidine synthase subunit PurQ [Bacteriovoracaceae bacterium]|nr:phosphoribosylformylglycinamidine synthase subunit PurQ [Bacteriovoracaceae bacterium]
MRKVLVLMGDGINSERELARAFEDVGAEVRLCHVNEMLSNHDLLRSYQLLALPGGFSFGDELRSGKILAEKLKVFTSELKEFLTADGRVLGICNGFQVLSQLGAFDLGKKKRSFTLTENDHQTFINRWVKLRISLEAKIKSPWFEDLEGSLLLPVRHREGRIVCAPDTDLPVMALSYQQDVNGSHHNCAAVVSDDGRIFGLMPHPEVATHAFLYPTREGVEENIAKVRKIFKNGIS